MEANVLTQYLLYQLYHARVILHSLQYEGKEEQIHDFRIALRHIRSLVKLFPKDTVPFPEPLKSVMKATNPIRELDVLLDSLSLSHSPKLFKQLTQLREESLKTLFTPEFTAQTLLLLEEYGTLLHQSDPHFIPEIMIQRVLTQYQHCLDTYHTLKPDAKSKALHRLRIDYKDARYGFEFLEISNLHPCRELILLCKQRQNQLGAVQDAANQVKMLKKLIHEFPSSEVKEILRKRKKALQRLKDTTRQVLSPSM